MISTFPFFIGNIYNHFIVLLAQLYTNLLSPGGVHPHISSPLRLLVICIVRADLFVIYYCLCILSKKEYGLPWQMPHQRFQRFDFITHLGLLLLSASAVNYKDTFGANEDLNIVSKLNIWSLLWWQDRRNAWDRVDHHMIYMYAWIKSVLS